MSEFECRQGHIVAPSQMIKGRYCPECGEPIVRMNGMSGKQLTRMDKEWDRKVREQEEELEEEKVREEVEDE